MNDRLRNRRILVVEDEYFLASEMEQELSDAGAVVIGPAASVGDALALVEQTHSLDAAILDVNLRGEPAYPVADTLMARGVPFVFVTGYGPHDIPARYAHAFSMEKPVDPGILADALTRMLAPT